MILLFFTGCEQKEDSEIFVLENKTQTDVKRIKQQFENANLTDAFLKEAFKVKWNQYEIIVDSDGNLTYEFSTNLRSKFDLTSDSPIKSKNTKKIFSFYKLLAKESADGTISFEILKFTGNNRKELKDISLSDLSDFNGAINYSKPDGTFVKDEVYNFGSLTNTINRISDPSMLSKAPSVSVTYVYAYIATVKDLYTQCMSDCGADTFSFNGNYYYSNSTGISVTFEYVLTQVLTSTGLEEGEYYHNHFDAPDFTGPHGGSRGLDTHIFEVFTAPSMQNTKALCAWMKLQQNDQYNSILDKLIPKNSEYDAIFNVTQDLVANGKRVDGKTSVNFNSNIKNIEIHIDKFHSENSSIISVAETILHESVHARLIEMVKSVGGLDKLQEFTAEESEIGKLAACFNKYNSESQHDFIWNNYVDEIAIGLENFHKLYPDDYQMFHNRMVGTIGYNKATFYKDVAKASLNKTSYFKSLTGDQQLHILNMHQNLKVNGKKLTTTCNQNP